MKLVITQHRPVRKALVSVSFIGVALLGIAIALDYGHWKAVVGTMIAKGKRHSLLDEIASLREQNGRLRFELARIKRADEINANSRRVTHDELVRLQATVATLNRELEFYRDVVGATEVEPGPKLNGVEINELEEAGRYRYRFVLTHVDKYDHMVEGDLAVHFVGELHGRRESLEFRDVVASGPDKLAFNFRHFRLFEGTIRFPDGFVPRQIRVLVRSRSGPKNPESRTFDWTSVLN